MNHDSRIWNLPRKVEVCYKQGWKCRRTKFNSLDVCEKYLTKEIGRDTYIHLPDEEVEDCASAEVITSLCGNSTVCATVLVGDAAWKGNGMDEEDRKIALSHKAHEQMTALRAMRRELKRMERHMKEHAERLARDDSRMSRSLYRQTVRCVKHNIMLFARNFDK